MKRAQIRDFASEHGYAIRREPEHLAGDVRGWCIPLNRRRGWLWDAGPSLGVHYLGSSRQAGPVLETLSGLPGWKPQAVASDGFLGWVGWSSWSPDFAAALHPRLARRRPRQGPKTPLQGGIKPLRRSGWPSGRPAGLAAGTPPNSAGSPGAVPTAQGQPPEPPHHGRT